MNPQQPPRPEDALAYLNNYDKQGKSSMGSGFNLKGKNLLIVIGLAIIVIVAIIMGIKLITGGPGIRDDLLTISAEQQDIERWSTAAQQSARTSDVGNKAAVLSQFIKSDNRQLNSYIIKQYKLKDITKATKSLLDHKVDTALDSAVSNNRYDEEFKTQVGAKLNTYKNKLKSTAAKADNPRIKSYLETTQSKAEKITFE